MKGKIIMANEKIMTLSMLTYYDGKIKNWVTTELDEAIAGLGNVFTLKGSKTDIDSLPATDNAVGDIYLVGAEGAESFDEYYWNGTKWELMGTTATSLDGLVTEVSLYAGADGTGTVAAPADGTIIKSIYDKIASVQAEVDAAELRIKANEDAIEAINNADTGILAQAKEYADGKDEAIEAAQSAADTAQGEVDALEALVGTIPDGYTSTTIAEYAKELADKVAANGYDDTEVRGLISDNTTAIEKNATDIAAVKETADSAVQEVVSGTANGTIAVDGTDVAVTGLGTAAYKADTDFETAGAASAAENNAKTYSDGLNTAMDTRVAALEEATSNQVTTDDIDALFAGT